MNKRQQDKVRRDRNGLQLELVTLKNKLGRLGMWKTFHAMDEVTEAVGWELAELRQHPEREFRGLL